MRTRKEVTRLSSLRTPNTVGRCVLETRSCGDTHGCQMVYAEEQLVEEHLVFDCKMENARRIHKAAESFHRYRHSAAEVMACFATENVKAPPKHLHISCLFLRKSTALFQTPAQEGEGKGS
jgi:hypothetical protein